MSIIMSQLYGKPNKVFLEKNVRRKMEVNRLRQKSKQPLSWSSLNPEERNICTANQLNVQNQRVRQDLQVIHKGIEDEKRCENAVRAKEEIMLQNRFDRLSKASERFERRARFSLADLQRFESQQLIDKNKDAPRSASSPSLRNSKQTEYIDVNSVTKDAALNNIEPDPPATELNKKKSVRFGSPTYNRPESDSPKKQDLKVGKASFDRIANDSTNPSPLQSFEETISRERSRESPGKTVAPLGALSYFKSSMSRQISKGFSRASSLHNVPDKIQSSSAGEDELQKWRRHFHTRTVAARLKGVRTPGRRHQSHVTLQESMDANARMRRDLATRSESFTADKAWQLLNCRYLRLTPQNVKTLEGMCNEAGYDTSFNPHDVARDARNELEPVYKQLRANRTSKPHLPDICHK